MEHITSYKDLRIGRILYHVYGIARERTELKNGISKYIIIGEMYRSRHTNSWFIPIEVHYEFVDDYDNFCKGTYRSETSLMDCGILDAPGETRTQAHNLNRLFPSKADAELFIGELQQNKFSRDVDQEFADRDVERRKLFIDYDGWDW